MPHCLLGFVFFALVCGMARSKKADLKLQRRPRPHDGDCFRQAGGS